MSMLAALLLATVTLAGVVHDAGVDATPTPTASMAALRLGRLRFERGTDDQDSTTEATTPLPTSLAKPEMYSLKVISHIEHRFAKTVIASRLANPANRSQEIFFTVTLPESAFISKFLMEIEGKVYEAYVKEKQEAKQDYEQAVASGLGAAHVALSARDSNRFTVSVNIEPLSKVTFNLTYEELLTRRLGAYNHVVNLDPGQVVRDLTVDVFIKESTNITTLRVPELRSGNEVDADEKTTPNSLAKIERVSGREAHVRFAPTVDQQLALGRAKKQEEVDTDQDDDLDFDQQGTRKAQQQGGKDAEGLGGQFVVQYDVDRAEQGGEILINNGYFVHFFAPKDLAPLRKHALFVLDVSGSMGGRKIEQLKQAMNAILDDLNEGDYFNIIEFSYSVTVWNLDSTASSAVFSPYNAYSYDAPAANPGLTPAFPATHEYVAKAKEIVNKMRAGGGTNIFDTLKTVIKVAHTGLENITSLAGEKREPIIVFLTDGEPTVGETRLGKIFSVVQELNIKPEAAIFSLAFGDDADLGFLKKLSLKNAGFARKIYEASDAALQLRDFYRQIASPLLANVTFNYVQDKIMKDSTTKVNFHTLFSGSELVVAGRLSRKPDSPVLYDTLNGEVVGTSSTGASSIPIRLPSPIDFIPVPPRGTAPSEASPLERLWAYLTIKQLLEDDETNAVEQSGSLADKQPEAAVAAGNETLPPTAKQQALELALKYSFVTPLTSLVVVKPNETKSTGLETINPVDGEQNQFSGNFGPVDRVSMQGIPLPLLGSNVQHFSQSRPSAPRPVSSFGSSYYNGPSSSFSGGQALSAGSVPGLIAPMPAYPIQNKVTSGGFGLAQSTTTRPFRPSAGDTSFPDAFEESVESLESTLDSDEDGLTTMPNLQTTEAPDVQLISIGQLEWLPLVLNDSEVNLPFGENDTVVAYKIFSDDASSESNVTNPACKTPEGFERTCVYLHECSLSVFKNDIAAYKPYFCVIEENYAGVCCPEIQPAVTSMPLDLGFHQTANVSDAPHEEAVDVTATALTSELPNDPDFYPPNGGSQTGNFTDVAEQVNEESSALNPGFHPVNDMKTSIVEADPKPV